MMRAFLAVAVLAVSCSSWEDSWEPPDSWEEDLNARMEAGEDPTFEDVKHFIGKLKTDVGLQHASAVVMKSITKQHVWSRLKAVVWPEVDEAGAAALVWWSRLKDEDVDNIFWLLNHCPEGRGHVAAAMSRYLRGLQQYDPHNPNYKAGLLADPLVSRVMQPETMDWLLDLIVSEHKHCSRKGLQRTLRCRAFTEGMTVVYLAIINIDNPALKARSQDEKFAGWAKKIAESPLHRLLHDRNFDYYPLLDVKRVGPALESRKRDWDTDKLIIRDRTDFSGGILKKDDLELRLKGEESPDFRPMLTPPLPPALEKKIDEKTGDWGIQLDEKGPKYDLMPIIVTAVVVAAVVLASRYIRKRHASATGRKPRGRVPADAEAAAIPAWVMALDVAVCCLTIYSHMKTGYHFRSGQAWLAYLLIFCLWTGIRTIIDWIAPGIGIWGHVGADMLCAPFNLMWVLDVDDLYYSVQCFIAFCILLSPCILIYRAFCWLTSAPDAERAARELLDAEAEREATTRARASQRGTRPGLRKRANRGRRRDAAPRAPETGPPETKSETAAPEPKAPEPEPEPAPTRAEQQASPPATEETVLEPTAPEPKVTEPEPTPAPVAEPRAPSNPPVPESKVEEPVAPAPAALEAKMEEPAAAPEGFEIVARVLEHLNEPHLLPIFVAEEINDNVLPCLDPSDLIGLGVSQMTCLTILGAAHSAAKNKKLETEDVLDNVAKHQSVLEEALREHREEIKRLRIRELPEDLMCPITCEIMKDPVLCVEDGHTYERVAVEQWFATGARTSPATSQHLESTALAPNHVVRKLIAALLEEHRG